MQKLKRKNRAYCDGCVKADNYLFTCLGAYENKVMRLPRPVGNCSGKTSRGKRCLSLGV
jgi:hypothetical protein